MGVFNSEFNQIQGSINGNGEKNTSFFSLTFNRNLTLFFNVNLTFLSIEITDVSITLTTDNSKFLFMSITTLK